MKPLSNALAKARASVLLVEDDPAVRRSLQLLLRSRGFDVRAYGSSKALLADDVADQAVLLVADFKLADGDGIQVLEALRRRQWAGPAVLVTGFPSPDLEKRAKEAGFERVLIKPLIEGSLADIVERLLR